MKFFAFWLLLLTCCAVPAAQKLSDAQFLERVRSNQSAGSWGLMSGEILHYRRGSDTLEATVRLAVVLSKPKILAQIIINDRQGWTVGQNRSGADAKPSIIAMNSKGYKDSLLAKFGLRPEDLAMNFVYWPLIRELESDSCRGVSCRVFLLRNPDAPEELKVFIAERYFFPLKAQWRKQGADNFFRTLKIDSFKRLDSFSMPQTMRLSGAGWLTKIKFDSFDAGLMKDGVPPQLFRKSAEQIAE